MRTTLLTILLLVAGGLILPEAAGLLQAQEPEPASQGEEPEDLAQELAELRQELELAELRMEATLRSQDLQLLKAEIQRAASHAELQAYNAHGREAAKAEAALELTHQKDDLADAEEELRQLAMMYEINQLADATAQIVMDRATRDIERRRAGLALAENAHRWWMEFGEPLELRALEDAERLASAELESLQVEQLLERTELEMEIVQLRGDLAELQGESQGSDD